MILSKYLLIALLKVIVVQLADTCSAVGIWFFVLLVQLSEFLVDDARGSDAALLGDTVVDGFEAVQRSEVLVQGGVEVVVTVDSLVVETLDVVKHLSQKLYAEDFHAVVRHFLLPQFLELTDLVFCLLKKIGDFGFPLVDGLLAWSELRFVWGDALNQVMELFVFFNFVFFEVEWERDAQQFED
jgi:hypothetical protein